MPPADDHQHLDGEPRFCPTCGGRLARRAVQSVDRPVCERCGAVFWHDPKVVVAVLIPWDDGVLFGRRTMNPGAGRWSLPAGFVDRGEVVEEAARREVREETGLEIEIAGLVGVYSTAGDPVILVAYAAEGRGGSLGAGPEMSELGGFPPERLPPLAFARDQRIIQDWLTLRRRQGMRA